MIDEVFERAEVTASVVFRVLDDPRRREPRSGALRLLGGGSVPRSGGRWRRRLRWPWGHILSSPQSSHLGFLGRQRSLAWRKSRTWVGMMCAFSDQRRQPALGLQIGRLGPDQPEAADDAEDAVVHREQRVVEREQERERGGLRADAVEAHQVVERGRRRLVCEEIDAQPAALLPDRAEQVLQPPGRIRARPQIAISRRTSPTGAFITFVHDEPPAQHAEPRGRWPCSCSGPASPRPACPAPPRAAASAARPGRTSERGREGRGEGRAACQRARHRPNGSASRRRPR